MAPSEKIRKKLEQLPDEPGCYLMRNRSGRIIYVGKASSLRRRVTHYFQPSTLRTAPPKLRGLIRSVADIECIVAPNAAEAALTEGRLIKEYRPRYNVSFRDDKRFLLLRVDLSQPFSRFDTCRIQRDDGREYFGPYASAAAARAALQFIEKRFGLRKCRPRIPGPKDHEHCINDIVRYCSAPCMERITAGDYAERVRTACEFLRGQRPEFLKEIRNEMNKAVDALDFERAAVLRDTLMHLSEVTRTRAKLLSTPEMRRAEAAQAISELAAVLHLQDPPRVIEAYDISNISGTHSVGSMVCAVDGTPQRNRYRRFRIRTVEGIDDPGMMSEVIRRSFGGRVEEGRQYPDLVLVDGGRTQFAAARAALREIGLELPVAGLAKKYEELYCTDKGPPVRLGLDTAALQVLQRLRDEAHRFALDYHRTLRRKRITESLLDEIAGIGPIRKRQILNHFGSVRRLSEATPEQIAAIPGVGPELAATISRFLQGRMGA